MTWISTPKGLYGESGIRTHGTLTSTHAFQACTLDRSVISPCSMDGARSPRTGTYKRRPSATNGRRAAPPRMAKAPTKLTGATEGATIPEHAHSINSRREWDSNPRSRKRLNGFRDRPIRPLSHLSMLHEWSKVAAYMDVQAATKTQDGVLAERVLPYIPEPTNHHARAQERPPAPSCKRPPDLRAQEDSNLRPLDPQSNALSRLSYGHLSVLPCTT